jgi:phosphatidylglycerol---prolipoprotein diacylglyceryl transferase
MTTYWVHNLDPFAIQFGDGLGIRWYGLAYLAAFTAAYFIYLHLARRGYSVIRPDQVADFITGCAVFGVLLGGRLGYLLFYDFHGLLQNPLVFFRVWEGGMSAHGGILGVVLYTLWYSWKHQVNWPGLGDCLVVGAPLGLLFGRLANFMNGELYGRISQVPWAIKFPSELRDLPIEAQRNVLEQAQYLAGSPAGIEDAIAASRHSAEWSEMLSPFLNPRHPSQVYEGLLEGLLLFMILWLVRTRLNTPNGVLTGVFFVGYASLRTVGEAFRHPDAGYVGIFTKGQFLSIFLLLIGIAFLLAARIRPSYPLALTANSREGKKLHS